MKKKQYNFDYLPKKFLEPMSKEDIQALSCQSVYPLPKELEASAKAAETCAIVDDIATMKELYCVLAYAIAQHPDLLMDYLNTFHSLVKTKKQGN